jgi:hypothetical protein
MKRYRLILNFDAAKWMPPMIRSLLKANVRWRTIVRYMTESAKNESLNAADVAALLTGISVESVEEA